MTYVYTRPFGYNEFDGAGGGYLVKFASLTDGIYPLTFNEMYNIIWIVCI